MIRHEIIPYAGWNKCLRIDNGTMELIVTLEVGPRIIRCSFIGKENLFAEYADQAGRKNESVYHSYGGHRLWVAPEEHPKTIFPDNHEVRWKLEDDVFSCVPPPEPSTGFQKEMRVRLDPGRNSVNVVHRITNCSSEAQTASAWAVTVMAPGGRALIPQEPYRPHKESLLPVRPLVLWSYTNMADPRWTWGSRFIQLRQEVNASSPQKVGMANTAGWCAYEVRGSLFLKRFPCHQGKEYPDFGCNCEIFTNAKMLELESLSPLVALPPGESITHEEQWCVFRDVNLGSSNAEIDASLGPILKQCP